MTQQSIVCPFCPLCCDDITLKEAPGEISVDCPVARRLFRAAFSPTPARLGEKILRSADPYSLLSLLQGQQAGDAARDWEIPAVQIIGPTLQEAKILQQLQQRGNIRLVAGTDASRNAIDLAIARDGFIGATLGDAKRFADLVWAVGDFQPIAPRLLDRINRAGIHQVHSNVLSLATLSAIFHGLAGGNTVPLSPDPDSPDSQTSNSYADRKPSDIVSMLRQSRYAAIVIGDAAFDEGAEMVSADLLLRLIDRRNSQETSATGPSPTPGMARAVMVRLNDQESLDHVFRWRTNVSQAIPYQTARPLIRLGSPLSPRDTGRPQDTVSPSPHDTVAWIQVGGEDRGMQSAFAYVPAGIPGVDFAATRVRGDGAVTLPLQKIRTGSDSVLSRIEVLRQLVGAPDVTHST